MDNAARIRSLEVENQRLRRRIEQRPVISHALAMKDRRIIIDQGQTLESTDLGIKYSTSAITSLASAYDPNSTTSYPDGIGRGTLYIDGVAQTGYVLVINDSLSGILSAVIQSDSCAASSPISMSNGTGTSIVYRIF
jgi:hypothetical protein